MPVAAMFCLMMSVTRGWLGPIREIVVRVRPKSNLLAYQSVLHESPD